MTKLKMMGASLAGSSVYKTTINSNTGGGSKLQGLPETTNKPNRFAKQAIKRNAISNKRNHIFCMNQIGGIGSVSSGKSSRTFASSADGVKDCVPTTEDYYTTTWSQKGCLLYTSPSPRDVEESRMPSSA